MRSTKLSRLFLMFSFSTLLGLFGCDTQRIEALEEGVSSEAQVRAQFGEPEKIWDGAGGTRILEYNRQPEGATNYMISIGPDGKMSALHQVLTARNFAQVTPGMMMEDVRRLLGKPAKIRKYAMTPGETHYEWRFNEAPNQTRLFTVTFNADWRVQSSAITDAQLYEGGK